MRSYNGHEYSMHSEEYKWKVTPREQIEIIAHSTVPLTLSGSVITPDGSMRTQILHCGNSIDLKGLFTNFTSLKIRSSSKTKQFGFYIKTSARQLEEPHNPADKAYISTLPEPKETRIQSLIREAAGIEAPIPHAFGPSMEPEDMPFNMHEMHDDEPNVFEDDPIPPQEAHTPNATDPAVQPQGTNQPVPEAQPTPPVEQPQADISGQKTT